MTCSAFHSAFTGLAKCPCKPLRIITYVIAGEPVSGDYCARHAIALRRRETKGELEITNDEPIYPLPESIPFQGKAACST